MMFAFFSAYIIAWSDCYLSSPSGTLVSEVLCTAAAFVLVAMASLIGLLYPASQVYALSVKQCFCTLFSVTSNN
jgi:hypothetical protein